MYMYVYVCVCMYMYVYVCICMYMYVYAGGWFTVRYRPRLLHLHTPRLFERTCSESAAPEKTEKSEFFVVSLWRNANPSKNKAS